ncbi:MAG TPA: universal stress protein [Oculatellaceae cyanobacterium]
MKVLIAVDDSACSRKAFDYCLHNETWEENTQFLIVSVVAPLLGEYSLGATYVESMVEAEQQIKNAREKLVQDMVIQLQKKYGKDNVSGMTYQGFPRDSILRTANNWKPDLIVVGSHGRRGFSKFFLGSVAEAISREADCSVLIVKTCQCNTINEPDNEEKPADAVVSR